MYNASIKVLNSTNSKDFTVYTLRDLLAEEFLTPDMLREEVSISWGRTKFLERWIFILVTSSTMLKSGSTTIKIQKRLVKHLERLVNSLCGALELKMGFKRG